MIIIIGNSNYINSSILKTEKVSVINFIDILELLNQNPSGIIVNDSFDNNEIYSKIISTFSYNIPIIFNNKKSVHVNSLNSLEIQFDLNDKLFSDFPQCLNISTLTALNKCNDNSTPIITSAESSNILCSKYNDFSTYEFFFDINDLAPHLIDILLSNFITLTKTLSISAYKVKVQNMLDVREAIDSIDRQIVKLFSKRYSYVKEASNFKKTKSDVIAKDRIRDVLNKVRNTATDEHIDPDFIEKLYDFLVHSFISFEMSEFEKHKSAKEE